MAIPNTNVGTKEIQLIQVSLCLGKKLFLHCTSKVAATILDFWSTKNKHFVKDHPWHILVKFAY